MPNQIVMISLVSLLYIHVGFSLERDNITADQKINKQIAWLSVRSTRAEKSNFLFKSQVQYNQPGATINKARAYLATFYKSDIAKGLIDSSSRTFFLQESDLNNDGKKEILVKLSGPYFCGSGGCTFLLLTSEAKLITRFTVTDFPVLVGGKGKMGWRDLILQSRGVFHNLKYNGKAYPSNPSVQPVVDTSKVKGWDRVFYADQINSGPFYF